MALDPFAPSDRSTLDSVGVPYGTSVQGIPLRLWMPKHEAVQTLVFAGIHGNEPESTIVLSAALRAVWPDALRCAVVLCANPDGTLLGVRGNARGVDLNRNFPTRNWGPAGPSELSSGSAPASESETQALVALVERLAPQRVVALHSDLACVDDPSQSRLGAWLAAASGLPRVADVGYPTPGSFGTWCAERGLPVVTFEFERAGPQDLRRRHGPLFAQLLRGEADG